MPSKEEEGMETKLWGVLQGITGHSRLSKNLIKSQPQWMGPSQGEGLLLRGPEYRVRKILANGAARISMNPYYSDPLENALSPCGGPIESIFNFI